MNLKLTPRSSFIVFMLLWNGFTFSQTRIVGGEKVGSENLISFKVDSFVSYQIPNFKEYESIILFTSELKNTFYHLNYTSTIEKIEINIDGIKITPVELPDELVSQKLYYNSYHKSPVETGVYWLCGIDHMIKFNILNGTFLQSNIPASYNIVFLSHWIAVQGDNKILLYDQFAIPKDSISGISRLGPVQESKLFGLMINGQKYNTQENRLEPILEINGVPLASGGLNWLMEAGDYFFYQPGRIMNVVKFIKDRSQFDIGVVRNENKLFKYPLYWAWAGSSIVKYNVSNHQRIDANLNLPGDFKGMSIKDDTLFWINNSENYFSIDTSFQRIWRYPVSTLRPTDAFFQDKDYIYSCSNEVFRIYNKKYLDRKKIAFDQKWYQERKTLYLEFINHQELYRNESFQDDLHVLDSINTLFVDLFKEENSFEVHQHYGMIFGDFYNLDIAEDFMKYVLNEDVQDVWLLNEIPVAMASMIQHQRVRQVISLDSILQIKYGHLFYDGRLGMAEEKYKGGIHYLHSFIIELDKLRSQYPKEEDYKYYEAQLYLGICNTGWYTHEEICDSYIGMDLLAKFAHEYPSNIHSEQIRYEILRNQFSDPEDGLLHISSGVKEAYENYFDTCPKGEALKPALIDMVMIMNSEYGDEKGKLEWKKFVDALNVKCDHVVNSQIIEEIILNWDQYKY
jgi:hypothetical protein